MPITQREKKKKSQRPEILNQRKRSSLSQRSNKMIRKKGKNLKRCKKMIRIKIKAMKILRISSKMKKELSRRRSRKMCLPNMK